MLKREHLNVSTDRHSKQLKKLEELERRTAGTAGTAGVVGTSAHLRQLMRLKRLKRFLIARVTARCIQSIVLKDLAVSCRSLNIMLNMFWLTELSAVASSIMSAAVLVESSSWIEDISDTSPEVRPDSNENKGTRKQNQMRMTS